MDVATLSKDDGTVISQNCLLAVTPSHPQPGLLGRARSNPAKAMLFRPAGSIHMFFMRFAIDAVFCDRELVVLDVVRDLRPWRMAGRKGAKVVVELAVGAAASVSPGDRLVLGTIDA